MLLVVIQLFDLGVQSILLQLEFLGLLAKNFIANFTFETIHGLLEEDQQSACAVELVDELIAFLEQARRDDVFNVLRLVLDALIELTNLLILHIDQVQVVLFFLTEEIAVRFELMHAICDEFAAETLDSIVEVLASEDNTRATSQSLNLRSTIGQLGQEVLYKAKLLHHIEVLIRVNLVIECGRKLLERMDAILDLGHLTLEALNKRGRLSVESLHRCTHDVLLNLVLQDEDLSLCCEELIKCHFLFLHGEFFLQSIDHEIAMLFFSGRRKRVVGLQVCNLLLQRNQLFLRRHVVLSIGAVFFLSDKVLLLLNDLPEEIVAEVFLESGVELWVVR